MHLNEEPLAHSPNPPISEQKYSEHIENVRQQAVTNARSASEYYSGERDVFVQEIEAAAIFHDLGKLDAENQIVLHQIHGGKLPIPHEDAGVAELLQLGRNESVVLVAAHHAGLFCAEEEQKKQNRPFRDMRVQTVYGLLGKVAEHTDANLSTYLQSHEAVGLPKLPSVCKTPIHSCGFTRRIALSCLVDADHGDTACHYNTEVQATSVPCRWEERLAALEAYVQNLPQTCSRDALRNEVYIVCCSADTEIPVKACDAPVGSGKTTAVMANLLQAAIKRKLRHIIVVLPYTNIIKQSVKTYREALTLPGENPDDVVAEHHHRADFGSIELRQLATLWKAPVIVTTAVQFFETLGSHNPAQLRKLHELPGSAVFVDEMHTALPTPLWPQIWRWLRTWTKEWGGYLVLASGSLPCFWELKEFVPEPEIVPHLLPEELRRRLTVAEDERIRYVTTQKPMNPTELIKLVLEKPGPRLLIMNTVQSAAYIADLLKKDGNHVMHISTALAPAHRDQIVAAVRERLQYSFSDWTLVATSCVEAGMDFSFRSGFRERATTASLIQVGGRVSRGAEYQEAVVWDFRTEGGLLTQNPMLQLPRQIVQRLFETNQMNTLSPGELAKQAMLSELTEKGKTDAESLIKAENQKDYPTVSRLCRVINTDTRLVVVSKSLAERIRNRTRVNSQELLRLSVQMWTQKIEKGVLPIELLRGKAGEADALYYWTAEYDPSFLGYMAGALPMLETVQEGIFIA